jgi:general stress protein 26
MSKLTLPDLAEKFRDIDFAMLFTRAEGGQIAGRPMSNNREVEYDGDSFYFTWENSRMVADIKRDRNVSLSFQGSKGLLGSPPFFAAVEGEAELIRDKSAFKQHWNSDLERWFKDGVDTKGLVMIKVHATRIHYWDGEDEGGIAL